MTKQSIAAAIVFGVLIIQTILLKISFEANPDSFLIVLIGFLFADIFSAATYGIFAD
ncbi:hypothetical protein [Acinetobacter lwoffii]|uniref:hypothetical protein n=1 Tax=Acinetobacter lwoffii TaxID=28090 RepID=UPI0035BC53D4